LLEKQQILKYAQEIINEEATSIAKLATYIDKDFFKAVECIFEMQGRVVVTGIGKSANIAKKIGASFLEKMLKMEDVYAADEVFLTNSLLEIMPVTARACIPPI